MTKLKAPANDWTTWALTLGDALALLPGGPISALHRKLYQPRDQESRHKHLTAIDAIKTTIAEHLVHRIKIGLRAIGRVAEIRAVLTTLSAGSADSLEIVSTRVERSFGVKLTSTDKTAVGCILFLAQVLRDGFVSPKDMRSITTFVGSLGGPSASEIGKKNAELPRLKGSRSSTLSKAVKGARGIDPTATSFAILHSLCGGAVVKETRDGRVYYWNAADKLTSVGLDRFENIFSA